MILVLLILAFGFAVLALGAWAADRPAPPTRPDRRIAPDELALTGEDYRVHVAAYFARKYDQRKIVRELTGADK